MNDTYVDTYTYVTVIHVQSGNTKQLICHVHCWIFAIHFLEFAQFKFTHSIYMKMLSFVLNVNLLFFIHKIFFRMISSFFSTVKLAVDQWTLNYYYHDNGIM